MGGAVQENVLSHEKISCLISLGSPSTRKSPVSCLMRNFMSQEKISCLNSLGPPKEKISCLLSHEKISCLKRKSHVFSVLGPPMRKSPISCLMRKYHVSRENLMSYHFWVPPNKKISCLVCHEKILCPKRKSHVFSVLGPPQMRKYPVACLMRKSHV